MNRERPQEYRYHWIPSPDMQCDNVRTRESEHGVLRIRNDIRSRDGELELEPCQRYQTQRLKRHWGYLPRYTQICLSATTATHLSNLARP